MFYQLLSLKYKKQNGKNGQDFNTNTVTENMNILKKQLIVSSSSDILKKKKGEISVSKTVTELCSPFLINAAFLDEYLNMNMFMY